MVKLTTHSEPAGIHRMAYDNNDGRLRGERGKARRLRVWVAADGKCASCGALTEFSPIGFQADHVVPLFKGGADDESNMQVLCIHCHGIKTATEQSSDLAVSFYPEWLQPAKGPLTIVFGPPGSGKSTFVNAQAGKFDVVLDLDEMISELSGKPLYHAGPEWWRRAVGLRNRMLGALGRDAKPAWLILTGAGKSDRAWWIDKLKPAAVEVLSLSAKECIERINADTRRPPHVKKRHIDAVYRWWQAEVIEPPTKRRSQFDVSGRVVW